MNLIILGAPGSGKGTQALRLAERFKLRHISTGDLLRNAVAAKTELGRQVEAVMQAGELVSDEIVLKLIMEVFDAPGEWDGWILDGYPRSDDQAEALEDVLSANREVVDAVIYLDVADDVVTNRLLARKRGDDTPEAIRKRLEVYKKDTMPVLDFYELRYDVHRVDGSESIEEVTDAIVRLVDS